jgi:hypothetical protein
MPIFKLMESMLLRYVYLLFLLHMSSYLYLCGRAGKYGWKRMNADDRSRLSARFTINHNQLRMYRMKLGMELDMSMLDYGSIQQMMSLGKRVG